MKKEIKKTIYGIIALLIIILLCIIIKYILFYNNEIILEINSEKIILSKNSKNTVIDLKTLNSEYDTIITCNNDTTNIKINGKDFEHGKINLGTLDISKDNKIVITRNEEILATINTLPNKFPEYTFEGKSDIEGDYYITTYAGDDDKHYIMKLNNDGKLIYYKNVLLSFDFKKIITEDGKVRYTYLESSKEQLEDANSFFYCYLVVMDEKYNVINKISYDEETLAESHTYYYINDNEYIISTYEREKVNNIPEELTNKEEVEVLASKIKLVKNNETIWEFKTTDYEELYEYSTETNNFNSEVIGDKDYTHLNSITIDPKDGNILASFRNIDSILKLDINTGKLIWILGGKGDEFSLTEEQLFSKQHSLSFDKEGNLVIFDNGNDNEKTRIIKLKYNETKKTIEEFKEYSTGSFSPYMGSVQIIDEEKNIALICHGANNYLDYLFEERNLNTNETTVKFSFIGLKYLYKVNKI